MAGLLTTIYARGGQNCGYSQILARFNARLVFARFALFALLLSRSCSPGVLQKRAIPERAWGRFARMWFANGGDIDHLDADCGQNRRHSQSRTPTPMLAKLIPARGVGKLHALALAKPASLWQQDDTFASASPPLRSGKDYAFMQAKGRSLAPARRPEVKNSVFGLPFIP